MAEEKEKKAMPKAQEKKPVDFEKMLNSPLAKGLLDNCKGIFKEEEKNPDICEITIKAPSNVVLKLFKAEK